MPKMASAPRSAVGHGQQAARLQRHPAVPADGELDLHHVRGAGEGGVGVAVAEGELGGDVPAGNRRGGRRWPPLGVEHRRACRRCRSPPARRRPRRRTGRRRPRRRAARPRSGRCRGPAPAAGRRCRSVPAMASRTGMTSSAAGRRRRPRPRCPVRPAASATSSARTWPVGRRGADDPGPQLARGAEVVAEPAAAAQQAGVFLARQPGADDGHGPAGFRRRLAVASTASTMPW